jgi:hypothetical protein
VGEETYRISSDINYSSVLGSKKEVKSIEAFLEGKSGDSLFTSFCARTSRAIQALSEGPDTPVVNGSHEVRSFISFIILRFTIQVYLNCYIQITEYMLLKVGYESVVDWQLHTDYLRCNPVFHGNPRYDFVIVNFLQGRGFAKLACIFVCRVGGRNYRLALVRPLDKSTRPDASLKKIDKELSIRRWRFRHKTRCEVIPLECIMRGAVLLEDSSHLDDYFVIDTIDADMYLRLKKYPM